MAVQRVMVRAQDVVPYHYALWCSFRGGEPFANPICQVEWSEDGSYLYFLLDSHNTYRVEADAEVELVLREPSPGEASYAAAWQLKPRPST